ncbi:MAG: methyltransferase domain-containing protein [Anaerolineales bacterium]|nr:methyltransferase domain-containing protein [Anaerolineales bacterium]
MDPREYALMYAVEDRHWWYRGMAAITCAFLDRWYENREPIRILDAGCGTGAAMTTYLARYGTVWGMDIAAEALRFCRQRGAARLARASVASLPYAEDTFDLATSFDVLYEQAVPSDLESLRELRRVLARGGRLLLRLPAYAWMRRSHDAVVHTRRRYTRPEVENLLRESGFRIEHVSYANAALLPAAMLKKIGERLFPPARAQSDLALRAGIFNGLLARILAGEAARVTRSGLPFGLSIFAAGIKP